MQMNTIQTDAFSMDYCTFGQGQNTLVILPGVSILRVMGSAEAIEQSYKPLTRDFTIYVFERRNDMPPVYTVKEMARDTAEVILALKIAPVALFGASQGGMMAMVIAMEHPELVQKMILGSTSAVITEAHYQKMFEGWTRLARTGDAASLYLAFGEALYPRDVFERSQTLIRDLARSVTREDLNRFIIQTEGLRGFDVEKDLGRIECPTLVIGSRDDQVLGGEASERIAERLKHGQLHLYDGFGHAAFDIAPDYRDRMLRFLT